MRATPLHLPPPAALSLQGEAVDRQQVDTALLQAGFLSAQTRHYLLQVGGGGSGVGTAACALALRCRC
jgi:hypothetical protein